MQQTNTGWAKFYQQTWVTVLAQRADKLLPATSLSRVNRLLQFSALGLILFGVKLLIIQHFGNATPFWDQWDAEAVNLYEPYLNGTLTFSDLLAPHNEHRIFTTRVLALVLLQINGTWNPLLQMIVNAALHTIMLMLASHLLSTVTGRNYLPAILFFTFVLFAIPFGWENNLAGFQSQFYFALLFGLLTIWNLVLANPLSVKWWLGILWATLAYFSLASGTFALGAAIAICIIRYIITKQKSYRQLIAIALMTVLFFLGVKNTPTLAAHAEYKASSLEQLYYSLQTVFAWPLKKSLITALVCNIPALIFFIQLIRRRPAVSDRSWYLAGLAAWSVGQAISIAYGRATINLSPRYLDVFSMNVLVNFVCLLKITQLATPLKNKWATAATFCWTAIIIFSLGDFAGRHTLNELDIKRTNSNLQEINTRNFLLTGDISQLKNKLPVAVQLPYPDADRLAMILSKPAIRQILPPNINRLKPVSVNNPTGAFMPDGYWANTPRRSDVIFGSYHINKENGSEATGTASLLFNNSQAGSIEFDVTGYPAYDGMKVEIEQNGRRTPVKIKNNPEVLWATEYAKVNKGPFSLILTDSCSTAEMAVSMPARSGKLDRFTNKTLSNYFIIITLGLTILSILIIRGVLTGNFASIETNK